MRPRLLDLFSGAGGAAFGYHQAGFDVVGVDIKPQPRYPFEFIEDDAVAFLRDLVEGRILRPFTAIHASPPCQAFTTARVIHGREHPDLLTPTRELLREWGGVWVIENVPGAPMRPDVVLCGSHFNLRSDKGRLLRHRWFEFDRVPALDLLPPCRHEGDTISVFGHGGHVYHGVEDWREIMGIDWMTRDELAQAIPPAYTRYIGEQLLAHIKAVA